MLPVDRLRQASATDQEIEKLKAQYAALDERSRAAIDLQYAQLDVATLREQLEAQREPASKREAAREDVGDPAPVATALAEVSESTRPRRSREKASEKPA